MKNYPSLSKTPSSLVSLIDLLFDIYFPSWDACQLILNFFFTREERDRILYEAARELSGIGALTDRQREDIVYCVLAKRRPDWDYWTEEGRRALRGYHQALLKGLKQAARKPTDLSKVRKLRQRPKESPSEFLERLLEAFRIYTPIDPDDPANHKMINLTFVEQSSPDICKEIQRMDGFEDMPRFALLDIAQEVFDSRESEEELRLMKTIIQALISAQHSSGAVCRGQTTYNKRRKPLRRDQCAYCKRLGHWKYTCPQLRHPPPRPLLMLGE